MGGKSLVWACAIIAALALPANAQRLNENTASKSTRTDKVYLNTTETKDKVRKRFQSGSDVFVQEAERTHRTKHWRVDTYTTYEKTWQEYVSKSRDVWAVVSQEWVYPCPGPGYWRDVYGWKSETYQDLENKSQVYESKTASSNQDETLADQIGSYRTVSRISLGGGGDSSLAAAAAGGSSGGAEVGFSGDTGSGAATARQASAGKSKTLSGASKGTSSRGGKFVNLAGAWTGGLVIEAGNGRDKYTLKMGNLTYEATYDSKTGRLGASDKKTVTVDLSADAEGTSLTGTLGGAPVSFRRQ